MILVFDLDDTLYDELTFVKSGFHVVANYIEQSYGIKKMQCMESMLYSLQVSRNNIFNNMLSHFDIYTKNTLSKCISLYRHHQPQIRLYPEVEKGIPSLHKKYPLYIVTDGNKMVQRNKISTLGLKEYAKHLFITHRYGLKHSKPSPYCFLQIQKREKVPCEQIVYIGDNPRKDFVGIKPLGFKTIRVHTGQHKDVVVSAEHDADHHIEDITQLTTKFLSQI